MSKATEERIEELDVRAIPMFFDISGLFLRSTCVNATMLAMVLFIIPPTLAMGGVFGYGMTAVLVFTLYMLTKDSMKMFRLWYTSYRISKLIREKHLTK